MLQRPQGGTSCGHLCWRRGRNDRPGLGARFAAASLLVMTAVIQTFVYLDAHVTHGLWAVALLSIMKHGAGAISIDHLIRMRHESSGLFSSERT